ncbi:MAG: chromosomal replication initiator protein DnaA [Actinomycetota bacterium]|nr:chromosomal replication initiator protein DnaA [Actinomycetota bacterium]
MTDDHLFHSWTRIRSELRAAVADSTWDLYLEPLAPRALDGATLVIEAPEDSRAWVTERFGRLLQACAAQVMGDGIAVAVAGPEEAAAVVDRAPPAPRSVWTAADVPFNPRFTFDQFVIGSSNRLAHAAALSVAEMPGLAYNPLYICGPPGLGKTHLLHSIANYVAVHGQGLTVRYTTVEAFTNHFIGALHAKAMDTFKSSYRGVDVLLVDDVQFLQSKARTEQEFFHTFNALHATGAQVVLTSDRLPRYMEALEDRLRERLEAGLVTDVRPPDYDTRLTILRKRVHQDRVAAADHAALELIAERVDANIRALEGALIRTVAFGSLTGRPVTAELADEVLTGLYPKLKPKQRSIGEIQQHTAGAFGVSLEALLSTSRAAPIAWPRQVAMYLTRELTDQTLPAIGRAFGGRTHTTVMHACRRAAARIAEDPEAYATVRRLTEELRGVDRREGLPGGDRRMGFRGGDRRDRFA